jgi:hypothetical protein
VVVCSVNSSIAGILLRLPPIGVLKVRPPPQPSPLPLNCAPLPLPFPLPLPHSTPSSCHPSCSVSPSSLSRAPSADRERHQPEKRSPVLEAADAVRTKVRTWRGIGEYVTVSVWRRWCECECQCECVSAHGEHSLVFHPLYTVPGMPCMYAFLVCVCVCAVTQAPLFFTAPGHTMCPAS